MAVVVAPRREKRNQTAEILAGVGQAFGLLSQGLAQMNAINLQQDKLDLSRASVMLDAVGGDPGLLPPAAQHTFARIMGLEGLTENKQTGGLNFPESAAVQLNKLQMARKVARLQAAASGDPQAEKDMRIEEGLVQAPPSQEELDVRRQANTARLASAKARVDAAYIDQDTRLMVENLKRGAKGSPSGRYQVGTRIFNSPDSALEFVNTNGLDTKSIRHLTLEEYGAILSLAKERVDLRRERAEIDKIHAEVRQKEAFGPIGQIIGAAQKAAAAGQTDTAGILAQGAGELYTRYLIDRGVDMNAISEDSLDAFLKGFSNLGSVGVGAVEGLGRGIITGFGQGVRKAKDSAPVQVINPADAVGAVGFDVQSGETIFPGRINPIPPEKRVGLEGAGTSFLLNGIRDQLQVALSNNMSLEDAQRQLLVDIIRGNPNIGQQQAAQLIGLATQELLHKAARGGE